MPVRFRRRALADDLESNGSYGFLSAAEHAWGRGLAQRGWPELGWHVVGRDGAGDLVAVTVPPCGASEAGMERHCYQTLAPDGLVYRTATVPIAPPRAP